MRGVPAADDDTAGPAAPEPLNADTTALGAMALPQEAELIPEGLRENRNVSGEGSCTECALDCEPVSVNFSPEDAAVLLAAAEVQAPKPALWSGWSDVAGCSVPGTVGMASEDDENEPVKLSIGLTAASGLALPCASTPECLPRFARTKFDKIKTSGAA